MTNSSTTAVQSTTANIQDELSEFFANRCDAWLNHATSKGFNASAARSVFDAKFAAIEKEPEEKETSGGLLTLECLDDFSDTLSEFLIIKDAIRLLSKIISVGNSPEDITGFVCLAESLGLKIEQIGNQAIDKVNFHNNRAWGKSEGGATA